MKSMGIQAVIVSFIAGFAPLAQAEDAKTAPPAQTQNQAAFEVSDLPRPEPIKGQLGEPGAPSLADSQEKLAKAMLEKGICNASYYGEEFCKKQQSRTFRVTDQFRMEYQAVGAENQGE